MKIIRYPKKENWFKLLARPVLKTDTADTIVKEIIEDVRKNGDEALVRLTGKLDKVKLSTLRVSEAEIEAAANKVTPELKQAVQLAMNNIKSFHSAQKPNVVRVETMPGVLCWQTPVPIEKVGLYIPGGTAPLFSTLLMLAIPAKIAGCREIIVCTPPDKDGGIHPAILYAASQVSVDKVYKVGGAQAIAAMAYGTESIPAVYKIFGPGNQFVTAAKQIAARDSVAIDMPAGPSEVAVLADDSSNPAFVASDLLAQAEHMSDSQVILISTSEVLMDKVLKEVEKQLATLPRKEMATKSLANSSAFIVKDYNEMMELVNAYAPEHLIISTKNADELAKKVVNAGSVFIGDYTPESAGDYASGTNHTLPTNGYARSYSGVNLEAYYKKITFQKLSKEGLQKIGPAVEIMAQAEELTAHQRAVAIRLKNDKQ